MTGSLKKKYRGRETFLTLHCYTHLVGNSSLIRNCYRAGFLNTIPIISPFPRKLTLSQVRYFSSINFLSFFNVTRDGVAQASPKLTV